MRVTLVISSLFCGGAQKVISIMANYWAEKNWPINLLTFDDGRQSPFYELHPAIIHRPLGIAGRSSSIFRGVANNLHRLWVLRRSIRASRPDVVVSFMDRTNVLTLLATLGLKLPVVISERNDPTRNPIGSVGWDLLRRWLYPRASCFVAQTQEMLAYFKEAVHRRACVIPNPVPSLPKAQADTGNDHGREKKTVVAMGSLIDQKGFDLLLQAFSRIADRHPAWALVIWGEGPLRTSLEGQRDQLGLQDRVYLPGRTRKPFETLRQADLFVLSSRYEGFPNALCEAMACGLPVISFDCPSGPHDIIRNGIDGLLVPPEDVEALAVTMDRLMGDEAERVRLSRRAPEVLERFGVEKVMKMWEEVLHEVS